MRHSRAESGDRSNALWGRGSRGESRSNALWGRGGRRAGALVASLTVVFAMAAGATAAGLSTQASSSGAALKAYVPVSLGDAITQTPDQTFDVIVSSIAANRSDFGSGYWGNSRVLAQLNLTSIGPNSSGDGYGHGTFVAGIAGGSASGNAGAMPNANLVAIDVINDLGQGTTADVIRACDWIMANKAKYNIQVANFSLHSASKASVMFDPLD